MRTAVAEGDTDVWRDVRVALDHPDDTSAPHAGTSDETISARSARLTAGLPVAGSLTVASSEMTAIDIELAADLTRIARIAANRLTAAHG